MPLCPPCSYSPEKRRYERFTWSQTIIHHICILWGSRLHFCHPQQRNLRPYGGWYALFEESSSALLLAILKNQWFKMKVVKSKGIMNIVQGAKIITHHICIFLGHYHCCFCPQKRNLCPRLQSIYFHWIFFFCFPAIVPKNQCIKIKFVKSKGMNIGKR